jgi:hypothetical protein
MKAPVTHAFLAIDDEINLVYEWLLSAKCEKVLSERPDRSLFYFKGYTNQPLLEKDVDSERTPLVWFLRPHQKRGVLWTVGEVRFIAQPLRAQFPDLEKINRQLAKWLRQLEPLFSTKEPRISEGDYYLEAGIRNRVAEIHAFPKAAEALKKGQYFISADVGDQFLDTLCRALRLRGVPV